METQTGAGTLVAAHPQMMKVAGIGLLSAVLLIPISLVDSVIDERKHRRDEAVADITATWGRPQSVIGPVLIIPYRYEYKTKKEEVVDGKVTRQEVVQTAVDHAYFLPSDLKIDGNIAPKTLHRGIYEAVVYSSRLNVSGTFPEPDWKALKIEEKDVLWSEAELTLAVPDLRGAKGAVTVLWGGSPLVMFPGTKVPGYSSGAHAALGDGAVRGAKRDFSLGLDLNGSGGIQFAPLGIRNVVSLRSSWPDPKFQGAFLPADRRLSKDGFTADWDVSYYGRSYPQQSTARGGGRPDASTVAGSLFGVAFLSSVDAYRNVERSTKYGILFIAMIFLAFFLFETLAALKIHPVQYVLVGLTLALFFLLLLSLSEFLPFGLSYLLAAAAAVSMTALYSGKFLGSGRRTAALAGEMVGVYGYLYVVLQLQDFSLLMGSVLLTATLAALMYLTRNVDWYAVDADFRLTSG